MVQRDVDNRQEPPRPRRPPAASPQLVTTASGSSPPRRSHRPIQAKQATIAARRYFLDGRTVKEIGSELGISRFKAARLIDWARAEGLVKIEVISTVESDVELSEQVRTQYGLRDAVVVAGLDGRSEAVEAELAEVASSVVAEVVRASDVVGISWGRTLDLVVDRMPNFSARRVVQLVGGLATLESASGGIEVVRRLAAKGNATGYPLLAPVRLRDPAVADALRHDPAVAETLGLIDEVTLALAGVGSWEDPPVSRMIECFDQEEVRGLRARGVVADLCGFLLDQDGRVVQSLENERIGIALSQLQGATVLVICGGSDKHVALSAILRSGLADILVTDAGSAAHLLTVQG